MRRHPTIADAARVALALGRVGPTRAMLPAEARRYRAAATDAMLSARRYELDAEATAAAAELGGKHPDILLAMLERARLPHERMWIEYDVPAFVSQAPGHQLKPDAALRGAAYLQRLHPTLPCYRWTPVFVLNDGLAYPDETDEAPHLFFSPTCIEYDLRGQPAQQPDDLEFIIKHTHRHLQTRGVQVMGADGAIHDGYSENLTITDEVVNTAKLGSAYHNHDETPQEYEFRRAQCDRLTRHAAWQLGPPGASVYRREAGLAEKIIGESIIENAGGWRLAVSIVALLNAQDFTTATPWRAGTGKRWAGGTPVPYMEHLRVRLRLPRKAVVQRAITQFAESIPRRRHEVAGHWRHRHGVGNPECQHVFTDLSDTRQRCALCGWDRWFVAEHWRGDATIGIVTKDRVVTR